MITTLLLATLAFTGKVDVAALRPQTRAHAFEVYRAEDTHDRQGRSVSAPNGETFTIGLRPVIDERHVARVEWAAGEHGPAIKLTFTKAGAAVFRKLARDAVGRRLVFLVRGRCVMAPVVEAIPAEDYTWIEGYVTRDDFEVLASAIPQRRRS